MMSFLIGVALYFLVMWCLFVVANLRGWFEPKGFLYGGDVTDGEFLCII